MVLTHTHNGVGRAAGWRTRAGMSFPELLLVLVVLGIIAGMATISARGARTRGELARLATEAHNFRLAQEMYRSEAGRLYAGPFTPQAVKAAGFNYTPPPDVAITIESGNEADWQATMATTTAGWDDPSSGPVCRLSLGVSVSCALGTSPRREHLDEDAGGTSPSAVTPAR